MSDDHEGDEIVAALEIARRLGYAGRGIIHDWMNRYPDFPRPIPVSGTKVKLWWWRPVLAWAYDTGRVPRGGPFLPPASKLTGAGGRDRSASPA